MVPLNHFCLPVFGTLIVLEVAEKLRAAEGNANTTGPALFLRSIVESLTSPASLSRIVSIMACFAGFLFLRIQLNGPHTLYKWTILENHISLLPDFQSRALSYGQMHFWYFFKLLYPRHLCFDYGHACIPTVERVLDWRNLLPTSTYAVLLLLVTHALSRRRVPLLVGLAFLLVPLVPALNVLFPVGTLLAERLLFVPSMGFCLIAAELLVVELRPLWLQLSKDVMDPFLPRLSGKARSSSLGVLSASFAIVPLIGLCILRVLSRNADWSSERELFSSALKVCPRSLKVLTNHALLSMQRQRHEEALDAASTAVAIFPNQTAALVNAGIASQRLLRFATSVRLFQRCLHFDGANPKANGYLGAALYDLASSLTPSPSNVSLAQELSHEAVQYLEKGIGLGFDAPSILHLLGSISMEIDRPEQSIHYLEAAIQRSNALKEFRRGSSHVAVEDDINFSFTYNQLGNIYRHVGWLEKSVEAFQKGLAHAPDTIQIYANLGSVYRDMGKLREAREVFSQGLALHPESPPAALLNNLGLVEMDLGRYEEAVKTLEKAMEAYRRGTAMEGRAMAMDRGGSVEEVILGNIEKARRALSI